MMSPAIAPGFFMCGNPTHQSPLEISEQDLDAA
jgi:hypothetical protein